ncbi:hypothetical protein [Vannielia litorea]|uniref:hypothetical protein n=1 Tax=Vannielia litorea TaxID=1217970 RepID=UPI001BCEFB29|nr:hypothetical protein [Vannielia litorea]
MSPHASPASSPAVAFAMAAMAIALKAKTREATLAARLDFARRALDFLPMFAEAPEALDATRRFLTEAERAPAEAGAAFLDFLATWPPAPDAPPAPVARTEEALTEIEAERPDEAATSPAPEFDWQRRADTGIG